MSAAPAAVTRTPLQVLHLYRRCLRSAMRIRDGDHRSTYVQYVQEGFRRHRNERIDSYRSIQAADFAQEQVERMDYFHSIVRERDGGRGVDASAAEDGGRPVLRLDSRPEGGMEGERSVAGGDQKDDMKSRADLAVSTMTVLPPRAEVPDEKRSTGGREVESSPDITTISTAKSLFLEVAEDRRGDEGSGSGSNDAGSDGLDAGSNDLANREQQDDREEAVSKWIARAVPELRQDDIRSYARQLVDDGFDSVRMLERDDVVDAGIMTEDDLGFMKKAHRRALLNVLKSRKGTE